MFWIFVFYSCLGWLLDSCYRSLVDRTWKKGGFSLLPFAPSYGIGAVTLFTLSPIVETYPLFLEWILFGIFFGAYEYLCGRITVLLFNRRLWDYSKNVLNIQGHTDLLHAIYWATLSLLTLYVFHPWFLSTLAQLSI